MIRRYIRLTYMVILLLFLFGCTTVRIKQPEIQSRQPENSVSVPYAVADTLSKQEMKKAEYLPEFYLDDSNSEATTVLLLERARQHYIAALDFQGNNDTVQSQNEFEYAIALLNELAFVPGVDSNQEFTDLSKSVIEDYEKYISRIDILSPQSSIFALQEKLNQLANQNESPEEDIQTGVVPSTTIPLVINGHVEQYIDFFKNKARKYYETWLWRSGKYFPMMRRIFKEEGVPEELVFLSMVESGLNPTARSWAKAVGIWQFVKGTGKLYGLTGNSWYDERRDFEKATYAAAKHFKDLYNDFQDWYLVLAAYNSGAGRVSRAIKKSHSEDFWKMRPFLPSETRNYVPQYIAATIIALNPKYYGFDITTADSLSYDVVKINGCIDIKALAQCAQADETEIRELNPELLKWCTPPGLDEYSLRIPYGKSEEFSKNYASIPEDEKRSWQSYKVRKGDTFARIGKKFGVTGGMIAEANRIPIKKRLSVGQEIVIPVPPRKSGVFASKSNDESLTSKSKTKKLTVNANMQGKSKILYRIRKGDTLGHIAQLFDVRASDLRVWNDLSYGSKLFTNETLYVWVPDGKLEQYAAIDGSSEEAHKSIVTVKNKNSSGKETGKDWITYEVQAGDNLGTLAQRYGVSVKDIQRWNGLRSKKIIVGDKLEIFTPENETTSIAKNSVESKTLAKQQSKTYIVRKGDTLNSIAALFGVSVKDILAWNNLKDNNIYIGQELIINT